MTERAPSSTKPGSQAADVDSDGDVDVLSASFNDDDGV